ncbi:hypothetical protein NMY22_g62 [Coprinellus aureogranulatus]|nr:hypothetical protein NMY22_g62 [Coprinellus aureogranulatus]
MSAPQNIAAVSVSPTVGSPLHDVFARRRGTESATLRAPRVLHPLENEGLRLLILENISQEAVATFRSQGYHVDHYTKAFSEDELIEKIGSYHGIGIRSKTKITQKVIKAASKVLFLCTSVSEVLNIPQLLVIGCFCIGTNQVDLAAAAHAGIPVFNSPFSNSRSVAELVMSELVALSRQLFDRAYELKTGVWNKQSKNCWEVRGKTLGIVGYGHIGSQLSVLAEAFGMRVIFHDVLNIMPIGQARQVDGLEELLAESDFVTLHVPELPETINMISKDQLSRMKKGAYLINNALQAHRWRRHRRFPHEPGANGDPFDDQLNPWASELRSLPNIILTPHIGGSTEEAQRMIGQEVSQYLTRYLGYGSTIGAVNFPEVDLRAISAGQENQMRICHIHRNQPGVLKQVNDALSPYNVEKQYSDSKGDIAYVMADIADVNAADLSALKERISSTDANILTRFLT